MAVLRRKPRDPFAYVLKDDRALPEAERPRFIITPPTAREWADVLDAGTGTSGILIGAVLRCVDRLENHPDATAFGAPATEARGAYVDEMDIAVIGELGNAVADTMLRETDRKN